MKKLISVIAVVLTISFLAGCSKSPYEEGREFGERFADAINSGDQEKMNALQADGEKLKGKYENDEVAKKEFERGFKETAGPAMEAMMKGMGEAMGKAMGGAMKGMGDAMKKGMEDAFKEGMPSGGQ